MRTAHRFTAPGKIRKVLATRVYPGGPVVVIEEEPSSGRSGAWNQTHYSITLREGDRVVERRYTTSHESLDPITAGMVFEHQRRMGRDPATSAAR